MSNVRAHMQPTGTSDPGPPDLAQVQKLMQGLGMCLFNYQQIEAHLKVLLPHLRHPSSDAQAEPMHWRELIDSKVTLGPLVAQFKGKSDASDAGGFGDYLDKLVEQRNYVVHHFLTNPNRPLSSPAALEQAIAELREYMRFAAPFLRELRKATATFFEALSTSPAGSRHTLSLDIPFPGDDAH